MDRFLQIARIALALAVALYLAVAIRNNCAPAKPAGRGAHDGACMPSPTRMLALAETAPVPAGEVVSALAAQLEGSAILGLTEASGEGRISTTHEGLLLYPQAVLVGGDERPFVSLTVLETCTGRIVAEAASYIDRLGTEASAAYLRSQLTALHPRAGRRVALAELLLDPALPAGFENELRAQLRRAALGSPDFDWFEDDLTEALGLPAPDAPEFSLYVRAGGTRADLWIQTQVRTAGGESVLAEKHKIGLHPALAFGELAELVRAAAKAAP